jgi:thiol-disulfide isomerase/thioredoxin
MLQPRTKIASENKRPFGSPSRRRTKMRIYLTVCLAALACLLLAAPCSKAADESAADTPKEGLEVGDKFLHYDTFSAKTIDGNDLKFADYKGKVLFVDFWAAWCMPCRLELPYLRVVQDNYVGDKFAIVGISLDRQISDLRAMAEELGLDYPQLCDEKGWQSEYATAFSIRSIPTNFLLDANGVIVAKNMRGLAAEGYVAKALGLTTPVVDYVDAIAEYQSAEEPDLDKVHALLDKAIEGDPEQPEFYFFAAELAIGAGDSEAAAAQYKTGLEHKDKLPTFMPALYAYVNLGQIKLQDGKTDEALASLDDAIKAIQALGDVEKKTYAPYIPEIEKIKAKWAGGANAGGDGGGNGGADDAGKE